MDHAAGRLGKTDRLLAALAVQEVLAPLAIIEIELCVSAHQAGALFLPA